VKDINIVPKAILGAAWQPQKQRMDSGVYFPLFLVLVSDIMKCGIYYLAADLQEPAMFVPRAPLSSTARRAGWQGFIYNTAPEQRALCDCANSRATRPTRRISARRAGDDPTCGSTRP
jgi:type II restriction enzyme